MNRKISGYLWAWTNTDRGRISLESLRKFYPDANLYVNVDFDGAVESYIEIGKEIDAKVTVNNFQLGYCGDFGNVNVGRSCWPKEYTFEWVRGIYEACKKDDAEYMMLLEEDDFILKEITIIQDKFSMAIHPTNPSPTGRYRPNGIPSFYNSFITKHGGKVGIGYAAGGGVIFNREQFIKAWESKKELIWNNYDDLASASKIIGWADYILQFIMQLDGCDIIQNNQLCEDWEVSSIYEFEIVTGLKDLEIIKKL